MSYIAPTYLEFIEAYPTFTTTDPAVVNNQLSFSSRLLSTDAWGEYYSDAVSLDCAHNLVLLSIVAADPPHGALQAAAGPMSNVSAAGMSAGFSNIDVNRKSMTENWYLKTVYGQQFLRLRTAVIAPGVMAS